MQAWGLTTLVELNSTWIELKVLTLEKGVNCHIFRLNLYALNTQKISVLLQACSAVRFNTSRHKYHILCLYSTLGFLLSILWVWGDKVGHYLSMIQKKTHPIIIDILTLYAFLSLFPWLLISISHIEIILYELFSWI